MANLSTKTGLPSFTQDPTTIVNYFADPGFERATNGVIPQGYALYNDGAVAIPVNGAGAGATTGVTFLASNAAAIRGTMSAVLSKDANNRRGIGVVYPFTISQVDKGMTAGVDIEMVTSANYPSGGLLFYIYDVTNSTLITPTLQALPKLDNYGKFFSNYGLTAGTSYRFIFHIADNLTNAWTVKFDTMINSTTRVSTPGSIVTNDQSFIPAIGISATYSTQKAYYNRSGPRMSGKVQLTFLTVSAINSPYLFTIPDSWLYDNSIIAASDEPIVGYFSIWDASAGYLQYTGTVHVNSTSTLKFKTHGQTGFNSSSAPITLAASDIFEFTFDLPISQWAGTSGSNLLNQNTQSPIRAGTITPFAGATIPQGWLWCNGTDYAITDYPQLYAQIGTTWNTAISPLNGLDWGAPTAGRFRVPDLRNALLRGDSNAPNAAGVTTTLAGYQGDQFQGHYHQVGARTIAPTTQGALSVTGNSSNADLGIAGIASSIGTDGTNGTPRIGTETRPQNQGIKYIIKAWDESFNLAGFAAATATTMGLVQGGAVPGGTTLPIAVGMIGEIVNSTSLTTSVAISASNLVSTAIRQITLTKGTYMIAARFLPPAPTGAYGRMRMYLTAVSGTYVEYGFEGDTWITTSGQSISFSKSGWLIVTADAVINIFIDTLAGSLTGGPYNIVSGFNAARMA